MKAAAAQQHDPRQTFLWCKFIGLLLLVLGLTSGAAWAQGTAPAAAASLAGPWPHAAGIIVNPWATIALLAAGCLLLYHDLLTPLTWGATGTLGVIAVGLVFAAHVTVGGFGWVSVVLMLLGLAALLLEIHVFPGHGSAFAGFILMFVGMFLSLGGTHHTAFALTLSTVLIVISGLAFLAYLPKSPAWQKLGDEMHHQQAALFAPLAHDGAEFAPPPSSRLRENAPPIGAEGRTLSPLRPTGRAVFNNHEQTVVTEGDFLDAGTPIIVSEINGDRIVVEAVSAAFASAASLSEAGGVAA